MTDPAQKMLAEVLALPEADRAHIVKELLASFDGPADPDWETSWLAELDRRVDAASDGRELGVDWSAVRAELLAELP
ncbi:MAG: addiction module protein [Deltaproteobacteria bacterium]|nr:addiction module protein [Deltaproteobacteria bacterium]